MAKNLNVNLTFKADSSQAKSQVMELQALLNKIAYTGTNINVNSNNIKQATEAAKELQYHLSNAFNTSTGNLDLSKLNTSLKASKTNLSSLSKDILSIGENGQQAFMMLAKSIASADQPMLRLNNRMTALWTTMKNTMRWQFSSSVLHGLTGAVQTAYGYAQDLNDSLSDIRIVTGQSVDQMAKFAQEANKAAKALSTTTTEYTNAALIYYQQGDSDAEVQAKVETTLKMANVSRQSAEIVSDQMTAIWNNFDNGTKSLEYYADVITELGAATASSSEEIATGLEKFAAVADTVGLSYEYATAALATVTATTRQSADVVGTAFKTLFARIQDLELGETLDDGVTLGKYSEALNAVGISIMDQQGQLKDMNLILDDMGDKWGQLTKAQQVSLAQTVAGTRQYTQLVALMDNWSYFQENLATAYGSEGTLQEQADIYAESWEAARDRVTAAAENIYDSLLNDQFFIDINNGFAQVLGGIGEFVDGLGGLKGVVTLITTLLLNSFSHKIPQAINNIKQNFLYLTKGADAAYQKINEDMQKITATAFQDGSINQNSAMGFMIESSNELAVARTRLASISDKLSDAERNRAKMTLDIAEATQEEIFALKQRNEVLEESIALTYKKLQDENYTAPGTERIISAENKAENELVRQKSQASNELDELKADKSTPAADLTKAQQEFDRQKQFLKEYNTIIDETEQNVQGLGETLLNSFRTGAKGSIPLNQNFGKVITTLKNVGYAGKHNFKAVQTEIGALAKTIPQSVQQATGLDKIFRKIGQSTTFKEMNGHIGQMNPLLDNLTINAEDFERILREIYGNQAIDKLKAETKEYNSNLERSTSLAEKFRKTLAEFKVDHVVKGSEAFAAFGGALGSVSMALTSLSSIWNTIKDPDTSGWEKMTSILMSMSMLLPTVTGYLQSYGKIEKWVTQQTWAQVIAEKAKNSEKKLGIVLTKILEAVTKGWGAVIAAIGLAAIIALIASLVAGIKELNDIWNDDANAVREAKAAVEEAKEAFDEAKSSYESLRSSISEYEDMQAAFEDLTEGTKEWNEALQESNDLVVEMLRTYPELAQYFQNDNGKFSFTDTDAVQGIYNQRQQTASATLNTSQIALNLAENRSLRTDALRSKDIADVQGEGSLIASAATLTATMALLGAGIGSAVPILGTAIGAVVGAAIGVTGAIVKNTQATNESDEALNKLQKAYDTSGTLVFSSYDEFAKALDGTSKETIDALWNNREALEKLTVETALNTAQMAALIEANVANINAANDIYKDLSNNDKSLMDTIVSQRAAAAMNNTNSEEYKKARAEAEKMFNTASNDSFSAWWSRDNYDAYLKAKYGDDASNYRVRNTGGNDATLQKKNADGTWETVGEKNSLSNTAVLDFMTSYNLQHITGVDETKLAQLQTVGSALTYNGLDDDSILALQKDLVNGGGTSLFGFSPEQVSQIGQTLAAQGNSFASEYREALQAALTDYQTNGGAEYYYNELARKEAAEISQIFAEGSKELEISEEALESYADSLLDANEGLEENKKLAAQVAVANVRLAKGLNSIQEIFKDNANVLEEADESSLDYHEAIGQLADAMEATFGMEVDASFVKDNLEQIQKMAEGDVEALQLVRNELNKDYIMNLVLEGDLETELANELNRLSDLAMKSPIGTELTINNSNAIAAINEALYTGQATISDIEAMFNNANLQMPEYKTKTVPGDAVHSTSETTFEGPLGIKWKAKSNTTTTTDRVIPYFGDNEPTVNENGTMNYGGGSLSVSTSGNSDTLKSGLDYNGDDGTDKATKKSSLREKTKRDDSERYKEVEDKLENIEKAAKKSALAMDRLYGAGRLKEIDKQIRLQEKEIKKLKEKRKEIEKNLKADEEALDVAAKEAGVTFKIDEEGDIVNYTEQMELLYARLNAAEEKLREAQAKGQSTELLEEEVSLIEQLIQKVEEAVGTYDATLDALEDNEIEIMSLENELSDLHYEKLAIKLELQVELNEGDLKIIERQIEALGDDLFARAEAATLMTDKTAEIKDILSAYGEYEQELNTAYEQGLIDQADYIDGLKQVQQGYWDNVDALRALRAEMKEYYADTLSTGDDEFQKYMDFMEHPTRVMEHYDSILDLTGGEKDYEAKGALYEGIAHNRQNEVETRKAYYEMLQEQANNQKAQMDAAKEALENADPESAEYAGYKEAYEHAKAEWEAAQEYANQAEEDMLSAVEAWAEAINAVLENEIAAAADELEKALTNGSSFDAINTAMERAKSLSEEWLDNTNKIYETNKLMRTAQQALDKTTNQGAKQKLQSFIKQTQEMQDQEELSKFELELQQARYDLLLAEIALEEAQNAKSTVRLQRDSEGNFGYVYTADQDNIAAAQQAYDDADNNLYNLGLEGYQEYTEKYMQTQQEFYETITDLDYKYRVEKSITEEEYNQAMLDAQKYYGEKLADYTYLAQAGMMAQSFDEFQKFKDGWNERKSKLDTEYKGKEHQLYMDLVGYAQDFNKDLGDENAIRQSSWATTFDNMKVTGNDWNTAMNEYASKVNKAFAEYQVNTEAVNAAVGLSMDETGSRADSLKGKVNELKIESNDFKKQIIGEDGNGGLVKALKDEYDAVDKVTQSFQDQLPDILALEQKYEDLAADIQQVLRDLLALDGTHVETSHTHTETTIKKVIGGDGSDPDPDPDDSSDPDPEIKPYTPAPYTDTTSSIELHAAIPISSGNKKGILQIDQFASGEAKLGAQQSDGSYFAYGSNWSGYVSEKDALAIAEALTGLYSGMVNTSNITLPEPQTPTNKASGGSGGPGNRIERKLLDGADTGAYTGEWGPWGKLAWIHEKELILNAHDTENMLMAVNIVRDLMNMFDPSILSNLVSPFMNLNSLNSSALEQMVHIEASFPSVTDRYEIEEALGNLINTASQFANRKHL